MVYKANQSNKKISDLTTEESQDQIILDFL